MVERFQCWRRGAPAHKVTVMAQNRREAAIEVARGLTPGTHDVCVGVNLPKAPHVVSFVYTCLVGEVAKCP